MKYYVRMHLISTSFEPFVEANLTSDSAHFERRVFQGDTCAEVIYDIFKALPAITHDGNELDVTFSIGESEKR